MIRVPGRKVTDFADITRMEVQKRDSETYRLIKTSRFMESSKANFESGYIYRNRHFVDVNINSSPIKCRINNSFDGSMAFSISLTDGDLNFGHIRQVHRGEHAADAQEISLEMIKLLYQAPKVLACLKQVDLPESTRSIIFNKIVYLRGIDRNATILTNIKLLPTNGYDFIIAVNNLVKNGEIEYKTKKSHKIKTCKPIKNEIRLLDISTKIWKEFRDLHLEFYI